MFTEIYIEALLVDEEAADQVWEAWNTQTLNNGASLDDYCWANLS